MEGERSPDEQFTWEEVSEAVSCGCLGDGAPCDVIVVMLHVVRSVSGPSGWHHPQNAAPDLREAL